MIREDKKGAIPEHVPEILTRLDLDTGRWIYLTRHSEHPFKCLVGAAYNVRSTCETLGECWTHGIRQCKRLFSSG